MTNNLSLLPKTTVFLGKENIVLGDFVTYKPETLYLGKVIMVLWLLLKWCLSKCEQGKNNCKLYGLVQESIRGNLVSCAAEELKLV